MLVSACLSAQVHGFEGLFGAEQQNAKIIASDAEIAANLVFIALFEKNVAEQAPVQFREFLQHIADLFFGLFRSV